MSLKLSKLHEKLTENKKMYEKYTACPILSLEFRSELPIFDQNFLFPIGIMDCRSEKQNSDRNSGFSIKNSIFQFDFSNFFYDNKIKQKMKMLKR